MVTDVTVIVPTLGRESLTSTLVSLHDQVGRGDEVIVVSDTEDFIPHITKAFAPKSRARWTNECTGKNAPLGAYGHGARNYIMECYMPDGYFWSIDDDDIAAPNALNTIRTAIESFPGAWFILQMEGGANSHYHGLKVPNTTRGKILPGNVGTPCIVWPASAEARWGTSQFLDVPHGPGYFGDYQMAASLHRELGDPVWIDEVIAIIRP